MHANYLIGRFFERAERSTSVRALGLFSHVLRYPICNLSIIEAILRVQGRPETYFDKNREQEGERKVVHTDLPRRLFRSLVPKSAVSGASNATTTFPATLRHADINLPRGFKYSSGDWCATDDPLPLLRFLHLHPRIPSPSAHTYSGYALTRAVHVGFEQLVQFMLEHGADPGHTDGLAVSVAVKRKDLKCVRMLIERNEVVDGAGTEAEPGFELRLGMRGEKGRKRRKSSGSYKKRKLEDRVEVNAEMLRLAVKCDAWDIVDYFMKEKGCVPDIQTLALMSA